jgi:hypothetical protein
VTKTRVAVQLPSAEELLAAAAQLQAAFWDALLELEGALGSIEIDGNRDLSETTIDELLAERNTDSGKIKEKL